MTEELDYPAINAATVDRWVDAGWKWGIPVDHEECERARKGEWSVKLTPTKDVPAHWFPELEGKRLLGLASGGGQQMPLFSLAGARCTVLDNSSRQLDSERMVAEREGYSIMVVRGDMTKPLPFADESFDVIFHPVSNCYVRDVQHVWDECARILKPGGVLMAGMDNGFNYLFAEGDESRIVRSLPFDPLMNPDQMALLEAENGGVQFSHSIEEQIAGQLRAGLTLLDVYEDTNSAGFLYEHGVPTFWATLCRK